MAYSWMPTISRQPDWSYKGNEAGEEPRRALQSAVRETAGCTLQGQLQKSRLSWERCAQMQPLGTSWKVKEFGCEEEREVSRDNDTDHGVCL